MSFIFQQFKSPIGTLYLTAKEDMLYAIIFECNWSKFKEKLPALVEKESAVLQETAKQLCEYFQGKRTTFTLPYTLQGTEFQNRVWNSLLEIPFGKTRTYKDQAISINSPKAVRAVGRTNGLNPLCIILPCHRVVGSNGTLTGYAGGLAAKKLLLELESRRE